MTSQISLRRDALALFDLREDELWPDLRITGAGVLRTGLGEHHEQYADHNAQAADRNKVPAEVIAALSQGKKSQASPPVTRKRAVVRVTLQTMTPLPRP